EAGFETTDPSDRRVALLEAYLEHAGILDADSLALLAEILVPAARTPIAAPPEERRRRAMDLLSTILLHDDPPRLLIVEDAHWADPSTAQLMGLVLERV